ncbi:hypothetical protein AMTR_s00058p00067670 [Amborella trichopoda]|uniref:Uncharacterized protein n=1 Tax=Amborella trichopoda TaxID=13333 RepID=W1PEV2_AMBTC|nr:hypothetical protein AMTR_s00058p00067670 [Amborella trichopoda]
MQLKLVSHSRGTRQVDSMYEYVVQLRLIEPECDSSQIVAQLGRVGPEANKPKVAGPSGSNRSLTNIVEPQELAVFEDGDLALVGPSEPVVGRT